MQTTNLNTTETKTATRYWPVVSSQYGTLSRGRHSARQSGEWAEKSEKGNLILTSGTWLLHCSDGFSRTARGSVTIPEDGYATKDCDGLSLPSRFSLVGSRSI